MIVVQLAGGLGNQLFQYAMGRCLADLNDMELRIDTSVLAQSHRTNRVTPRAYALEPFCVRTAWATESDTPLFRGNPASPLNHLRHRWQLRRRGFTYVQERTGLFQPIRHNGQSDLYLRGYWQSEQYAALIAEQLRQDLTLKRPLSLPGQQLAVQIASTNSVAVHVRRGDYVTNPRANRFHGVCPPTYYERAIERVAKRSGEPTLFVFSDDPAWCAAHFRSRYPVVLVDVELNAAAQTLWLMSRCGHQVVANSSFSWWAAWLNPNPAKQVVAPRQWFRHDPVQSRAIIPVAWGVE